MFHLNRVLMGQGGFKEKVQGLMMPQIYIAVSISDFLNERKEVETSGLFKSLFLVTNVYHKAVIAFLNVRYHRLNHETAQLEDLSATLDLPIKSPAYLDLENEKKGIVNGDRIQQAVILYNPTYDRGVLVHLEKFGNWSAPERVKPDFSLKDLVSESGY